MLEAPTAQWDERLFPYQRVGAERLATSDSLLLADDMGLGKTIQTIAGLKRLAAEGTLHRALIVVPASIIPQWRQQLLEWAPRLRFSTVRGAASDRAWKWRAPADIYLTSYETLRSDFSTNPHSPVGQAWDVAIVDEAQRIKNRDTEASRACKALNRRRGWALTGTPIENQFDDLASILEFTQPNLPGQPFQPLSRVADVRRRQGEVQLRRRKVDVLHELPPKMQVQVPLELGPAQRRAYDRAEQEGIVELKRLGTKLTITHVLELILRLKQICNFCPESGESSKADDIEQRLGALKDAGEKALVFSQFTGEHFGLAQLGKRLARFRPLVYSGELDTETRAREIDKFNRESDRRVLLLSLRAGGLGLNLQSASYVFHFDRWWNPAVERQAEDRAHRMGQENPVFVYTYICRGTVEERIEEILREKTDLFDSVVDGPNVGGAGLSEGELRRVVRLDEAR